MSRIIRLVSDPLTVSRFTKAMPAPIILEPDSTIALKSISFELAKDTTFDVPDDSYFFYFSVGDKNEQGREIQYRVAVPRGTYTQDSLIQTIQFQMNQVLAGVDPTKNTYGFEWSLSIDSSGVLTIAFDRADKANIQSADVATIGLEPTGNTYTKNIADTGEYNSFGQVKSLVSRGGLSSQITLGGTSPETSQFIVGLCPTIIQGGLATVEAMSYAVYVADGTYAVRSLDGTIVTTAIVPQTGADVKIIKEYDTEQAKGWISIYQDTTLIHQQYVTETFVNSIQYFTFAIGDSNGGVDITFSDPALTPSPFVTKSAGGAYTLNKVAPSIYVSDLNTRLPSKVTLVFSSVTMQQFLGFFGQTLTLNALSGNFVANQAVAAQVVQVGDDLIVELQNLPIEGYDTLSGLMAPIVAVIPVESLSTDASGLGYSYIEPFVTKVKLHNKSPLNVNALYVNIRSGGSNLALTDRVFIQLLVE